jgi:hypothetical protein
MTRLSSKIRTSLVRGGISIVVGVLCLSVMTETAWADSASDTRAIVVRNGHVSSCSQVGFGSDTTVGSSVGSSARDANISGTVTTAAGNQGTGGRGQYVNISLTSSTVVVNAVVVEGGNGYNKYTDQTYLPPRLRPHQHYIPPLNNGRQLPTISRWFVCYHIAPPSDLPESPSIIALPIAAAAVFAFGWYWHRRRATLVS